MESNLDVGLFEHVQLQQLKCLDHDPSPNLKSTSLLHVFFFSIGPTKSEESFKVLFLGFFYLVQRIRVGR